jgi:hypothetical protein
VYVDSDSPAQYLTCMPRRGAVLLLLGLVACNAVVLSCASACCQVEVAEHGCCDAGQSSDATDVLEQGPCCDGKMFGQRLLPAEPPAPPTPTFIPVMLASAMASLASAPLYPGPPVGTRASRPYGLPPLALSATLLL